MAKETKKRNRKEPDEYTKVRTTHRKNSERHVLCLETDMSEDDKRHTFNLAERERLLSNILTARMQKNLDQFQRTRAYREIKAEYRKAAEKVAKYPDKESKEYKTAEKERKAVADNLNVLQKQYNVTWDYLKAYAEEQRLHFDIPAVFALTIAEDVWAGVEKILFGDGKKLNFKKMGDLPFIRAKQPNRGIIVKVKDGKLNFSTEFTKDFSVIIKKDDIFAQEEVDKIIAFMSDPDAERKYIDIFKSTDEIQNIFRICYCTLCPEIIRGKLRVFIHITIEGRALSKKKKDGSPRHQFGKGAIGVDIGTQSIAVVSDNGLILDNLAERNNKSTKSSERNERLLNRKLDRSRRATNPELFNENGTVKKGSKGKFKKSKTYLKNEAKAKEIRRKNALNRLYAIREMANKIRSMGDVIITEKSNAKALQKKAKPETNESTTASTPTTEITTKKKNKRRKRFGKSILHRCPGTMHSQLKSNFEATGGRFYEVDTNFRASQYDHKLDDYIKKKLSQRWHKFEDGTKVQRDLYSAFLMFCTNKDFTAPDKDKCNFNYDNFYIKETKLITDIRNSGRNICNSGIKTTAA